MKKVVTALLALAFVAVQAFALEVDRQELQTAQADAVRFINYSGPQDVVSTASEILGIGTELGSTLLSSLSSGDSSRYRIIHAVDPAAEKGFDADILIIGSSAAVDHIDNVRRILAGYLAAAYGYSAKDASTLAVFVTVYNAVNRGKLESFKARYKPVVMNYLTADKVGLSLRYDEWPGKTQIVVPLSNPRLAGTLSSVDTSSLTAPEVVGKMKEDPNAAVDTRKDMVDLKERESAAAQDRAETAQKEAAAAKAESAQAEKELAAAKTEAAAAAKAADEAAKTAEKNPSDAAAQKQAADAAAAAAEKKEAAEAKEQALAETKASIAESEKTAAEDQKIADTKTKEAQTERKDIASDVQKQVDQKAAEAAQAEKNALAESSPAWALRIIDPKSYLAELLLVDLNTGKVLKTSSLNSVRNRTLVDTGSGLMAVAGKKGGNATVKLVLIDPNTLDVLKEGSDAIAEASMLVRGGNDYYAVVEGSSGFSLARFDANLAVKAKTTIQVLDSTVITVTDKGVLAQTSNGAVKLFRATDLVDLSAQ